MAFTGNDGKACGIWDGGAFRGVAQGASYTLARSEFLRGELDEALRLELAAAELVNGDAVSCVVPLLADWIGDGADGGVETGAIGTEGEAEEVALMGVVAEALVGKIGEAVGLQIEDGDRLMGAGRLGAVAVVQERGVTLVRAERDGGGETVYGGDQAWRGNGQEFAGGQRDCAFCFRRLG